MLTQHAYSGSLLTRCKTPKSCFMALSKSCFQTPQWAISVAKGIMFLRTSDIKDFIIISLKTYYILNCMQWLFNNPTWKKFKDSWTRNSPIFLTFHLEGTTCHCILWHKLHTFLSDWYLSNLNRKQISENQILQFWPINGYFSSKVFMQ